MSTRALRTEVKGTGVRVDAAIATLAADGRISRSAPGRAGVLLWCLNPPQGATVSDRVGTVSDAQFDTVLTTEHPCSVSGPLRSRGRRDTVGQCGRDTAGLNEVPAKADTVKRPSVQGLLSLPESADAQAETARLQAMVDANAREAASARANSLSEDPAAKALRTRIADESGQNDEDGDDGSGS